MRTIEELQQQVGFERWATTQQIRSIRAPRSQASNCEPSPYLFAGIENWTARVEGAEHRGQIALLVGAEGGAPVETEYIWWLRNGAGKQALT